jgi:hypothetical protein
VVHHAKYLGSEAFSFLFISGASVFHYTIEAAHMLRFCSFNGTARFKKCKQLFEYKNLLLHQVTSDGQRSNQN